MRKINASARSSRTKILFSGFPCPRVQVQEHGRFLPGEFYSRSREGVGGEGVKIIVRAVKVRGHNRHEVAAVLPGVRLAGDYAGNFSDGVGFIVSSKGPVKRYSSFIGWGGFLG